MVVSSELRPIISFAVCAVIVDVRPDGTVFVDRMIYTKEGRSSVRHLMETGEKGESVMDTLATGLTHEAARNAADFSFKLLSPDPIHYALGPDDKDPNGQHLKICYAVKAKGDLRNFNLPDGNETLGPITMVEIKKLIEETEGRTVPFHVQASKAVLQALAMNKSVFDRYQREIVIWEARTLSSAHDVEVDLVNKFLNH